MLCWLSSPVAEATDGGLRCFIRVSVKVSTLEGFACWSTTTRRKSAAFWVAAVLFSGLDGLTHWHLSLWDSSDVYFFAAGAGCCGCFNVCGTNPCI